MLCAPRRRTTGRCNAIPPSHLRSPHDFIRAYRMVGLIGSPAPSRAPFGPLLAHCVVPTLLCMAASGRSGRKISGRPRFLEHRCLEAGVRRPPSAPGSRKRSRFASPPFGLRSLTRMNPTNSDNHPPLYLGRCQIGATDESADRQNLLKALI
jgi:hypothetical protein